MPPIRVALVGDYNPAVPAHRAIPPALELAAKKLGVGVEPVWLHTAALGPDVPAKLASFCGVWVVPASPYADTDAALAAIRFARENGVPFLGTCGGFQHALIEFARNALGRPDAGHAETAPDAVAPLIAPLSCPLVEATGTIRLTPGSKLHRAYGTDTITEGYRCRFGLNPDYEALFAGSPLRVVGRDGAGEVRAVELDGHPFFAATLFQPERAALRGVAAPPVEALVAAAVREDDGVTS
jgi:CTP synthase (UTP-ammonia lyase)